MKLINIILDIRLMAMCKWKFYQKLDRKTRYGALKCQIDKFQTDATNFIAPMLYVHSYIYIYIFDQKKYTIIYKHHIYITWQKQNPGIRITVEIRAMAHAVNIWHTNLIKGYSKPQF